MTYAEAIAERILTLCAERELTANKLATLSGLSQSTLENVIKGHTQSPGLRTLHRIAQGFGMPLSGLLDFPAMDEVAFEDE